MDNVNRIGVGFFAPDFTLKDTEGKMIRLSDFFGKKNVLLFFFEGKRCGFYLDWLSGLAKAYDRVKLKNAEIIGISPDERWISHKLKTKKKIEFPILKDNQEAKGASQSPKASEQYGVQILKAERASLYPAIFVIDKRGIIRYRNVLMHPSKKLKVDDLLCELDKLS
jgi:peroxiredoxin Q/BCP